MCIRDRCYQGNDRIYLEIPSLVSFQADDVKLNVRGVFVNPLEVMDVHTGDVNYPIPENMIPLLKELIFTKELRIELSSPSDESNNSRNDQQGNVFQKK